MSGDKDFNIRQAYTDFYTLPSIHKNEPNSLNSSLPFTAYINKNNAAALLKYLSFNSLLTPFAVGLAHIAKVGASKLQDKAKYGLELVAYKAILPAQFFHDPKEDKKILDSRAASYRKNFQIPEGEDCTRTFTTSDGTKLEGLYLPGSNASPSDKTMIYFLGNGEHFAYESGSPLLKTFHEKGYNIIMFNYRGVGESTGHATKEGLFQDGEAVYNYAAETLKVPSQDILLYGHSLGAGIASNVAFNHPEVKFCHERSFTQLDVGAESLIKNSTQNPIGNLITSAAGKVAAAAIRFFDLNIDTEKGFREGSPDNRLAVYHSHDDIIDTNSSLSTRLKSEDKEVQTFQLHDDNGAKTHQRKITKAEAELIYEYFHPSF